MYLYTGEKGIPLREILKKYNNKNWETIICRCKWKDNNDELQDELFGYCKYINGILEPLDGDCYSLDDLYIEWKECATPDGDKYLIVWEDGYESNEWK